MRIHAAALLAAILACTAGVSCRRQPWQATRDLVAEFPAADWRSDTLDLAILASDPGFTRRGFGALERSGDARWVWSEGASSRLRLPLASVSDKQLDLRARLHPSLGPALPLELALNGKPLGSVTLTPSVQDFRVVLPASAQVRGDNVLTLASARQHEPGPNDADRRRLVAAFEAITVHPLGDRGRASAPHVQQGRLSLPPRSSVGFLLRVPPGARLDLKAERVVPGAGSLVVAVEDDGGRQVLAEQAPGTIERDLTSRGGQIVRLELSNTGDGPVRLTHARLLSVLPQPAVPTTALPPRTNLIVFLADTLRADFLGAYGHPAPTSPRLDAFAREGVLFERGWAQASWTRSAVASIFTGQHVGTHGVDREDRVLTDRLPTLSTILKAAGYRTGAFVGNHLVGGRFGFSRGFDEWNAGDDALYGSPATTLVERALRFVDAGNGPFLLYVHTMEPHAPYTPPADDWAPFAVPRAGDQDTRALLRLGQLGQLDAEGLRFVKSRYQGEVRANDRAFGLLLDGLRQRGLLDRSVVVFTADHGEEFLEHKGTEHAKTLYQELLHVPLVLRLPGAARGGTRIAAEAEQVDLLPTLLALTGQKPPGSPLPGRDLSARLQSAPIPQGLGPVLFAEERFEVIDKYAVRSDRHKLILNNDGPELWRAGAHVELYDLQADPGETHNLAESRPITRAWLEQELQRFRETQEARAQGGAAVVLTEEERERLRALGYVR